MSFAKIAGFLAEGNEKYFEKINSILQVNFLNSSSNFYSITIRDTLGANLKEINYGVLEIVSSTSFNLKIACKKYNSDKEYIISENILIKDRIKKISFEIQNDKKNLYEIIFYIEKCNNRNLVADIHIEELILNKF
jgi:hypothetical protein